MHHGPAKKHAAAFLLLTVAGLLALGTDSFACTLALISGKASATGRALMWKNRDTSELLNKLMYLKGPRFAYTALVDSGDARGDEVWGGLNESGFAIMNSQSDDLADKARKTTGDQNGAFMKKALGECATIEEFEALLVREKGKWDVAANFGVIDARGGACLFETSSGSFTKFDTADRKVAPFGYIVRTNFAYTSPDPLEGGGFIRFERISHLVEMGRATGALDVRFILQSASRDLVNEKLQSFPMTRPLPEDPARPLYINTNDTINRNSSASVVVFEAAPSPDKAYLATMWVDLGQPVSCAAVPVWPYAASVPSAASAPGTETSPLNAFSKKLVAFLYPDVRGRMPQYLSVTRLRTYGGDGVLPRILRIEDSTLVKAAERMKAWEKEKPAPGEVAAFQEGLAAEALDGLKKSFPDI